MSAPCCSIYCKHCSDTICACTCATRKPERAEQNADLEFRVSMMPLALLLKKAEQTTRGGVSVEFYSIDIPPTGLVMVGNVRYGFRRATKHFNTLQSLRAILLKLAKEKS